MLAVSENALTLDGLQADLWSCAQILRGSAVDRTNWNGYILPLLFFKRISDVWDDETAEARDTYDDWTLNLSRYVLPPVGDDVLPLPEAVAAFKQALAEARAAEDRLRQVLAEAGWLE